MSVMNASTTDLKTWRITTSNWNTDEIQAYSIGYERDFVVFRNWEGVTLTAMPSKDIKFIRLIAC